jgi:hypothetical protein
VRYSLPRSQSRAGYSGNPDAFEIPGFPVAPLLSRPYRNREIAIAVILSGVKNLGRLIVTKGEILRLRFRMTLRHSLYTGVVRNDD